MVGLEEATFILSFSSRRSEPGASERDALADEREVAREVLGRHHSDVDDTTSSESEEELKTDPSNSPSSSSVVRHKPKCHQVTPSTTSVSPEGNQPVRSSRSDPSLSLSHHNGTCCKAQSQQGTHGRSQQTMPSDSRVNDISVSITRKHKKITRRKRRSRSADCPISKVQRDSHNTDMDDTVGVRQLRPRRRRRSVPVEEMENSSSDSSEVEEESDRSSWSEESEEWEPPAGSGISLNDSDSHSDD